MMMQPRNLIELNSSHNATIQTILPLNDGAFIVRYDNYDHKICDYLGNGFMINAAEYPMARNFELKDGLLYFQFINHDWDLTAVFNMAGKRIKASGSFTFNEQYPKSELAKFKSDYPRMKPVAQNEHIGDMVSKLNLSSGNKKLINKYGIVLAMDNGYAYQLPFTDKKIQFCCDRLDHDLQFNIKSLNHYNYAFLSRYIMLIRMIDVMALNNTSNNDKYNYLNKQLDAVFLNTQSRKRQK